MTISGTTPTHPSGITRLPISVSDSQMPPQTVNASFTINVLPHFFKSLSYDLPLTFGGDLSFDLSPLVASANSLERVRRHLIELAVTGTQSWMSFNHTNFSLTGTAPSVIRDSPVPLGLIQSMENSVRAPFSVEHERDVILASSATSSVTPIKVIFSALDTDSQTTSHFTLNILLSPTSGSIDEAPTDLDKDQKDKNGSNRGKIVALSVVFGLLLLILIVGLLFCSLKNGSLLAFCASFKRDSKEKPLPPYFVDQRSLDGDTLPGGHDDLEKGMVGGILKKSGERGGLAVEENRKVSFALETPRPSTDAGHQRGGTSISSGSHYADDSSGGSAVPSGIKVVGRLSVDTTTSESVTNAPNPYILANGTLISFGVKHHPKTVCQSRTATVPGLLVTLSSYRRLLFDPTQAPQLVLRSIRLHLAHTMPRVVPNTRALRTLAHRQGSFTRSPRSHRHRPPPSPRLGPRPRPSSPSWTAFVNSHFLASPSRVSPPTRKMKMLEGECLVRTESWSLASHDL